MNAAKPMHVMANDNLLCQLVASITSTQCYAAIGSSHLRYCRISDCYKHISVG